MELNFKIQKDRLIAGNVLEGNSGSFGAYTCNFDILDNAGFMWLCVFKKDDVAYKQVIKQGKCIIPQEVLKTPGDIKIGCYGTYENIRISTNWLTFSVKNGAYCEATAPDEPTPDVWEELVMNAVPYMGETGNWYVYDKEKKEYVDSGVSATKSEEPHWELISSGELTEEVSFLTLDGFSCSKVALLIEIKGSTTNSEDCGMQFRTNKNSNTGGGTNNSLVRMFRTNADALATPAHIALEMHNKWITGHLRNSTIIVPYINVTEYDSITGLYLSPMTSGNVFGVGTTYELWGVKK